ncbi:MAG: ABC transporter permease [Bacteroidetes bacterium]|jgi:cell division transport system permease protein|nr:ABC transporter permease [Bacteroidota bacterium]
MALGYLIREGFSGFNRAKLSMSAAIFTITIALLLLSSFAIIFLNARSIVDSLRTRVEMEAFLLERVNEEGVPAIEAALETVDGVESVRFVSKDEAAEIFKQEFGEDIRRVLKFNPLPASFRITLLPPFRNSDGAASVAEQLEAISGVEEVKYRKDLLEMLDERVTTFLGIGVGVGLCILIASMFLVANTIRLAIYAKRQIIRTMKLIGATRAFIRFPFLLEGIIQGILGGLIAAGFIYVSFEYLGQWVSVHLQEFVQVEPLAYLAILLTGMLLGLLGSAISIRRFISDTVAQ